VSAQKNNPGDSTVVDAKAVSPGDGDSTSDEHIEELDPTYVVDVPPDEAGKESAPRSRKPPGGPAIKPVVEQRKVNTNLVRRGQGTRVVEPIRPNFAPEPPVGMANDEQLDGFRELRTRLLSMASSLHLPQFTTLIVPLKQASGASFVARNLAAAFTFQERRAALLVDCNLKHPTQHIALRTPNEAGLFDFLDEPYAQVDSLVHPTGIAGLHLLPAGHAHSRFREYFSSPAMRTLMNVFEQAQYYVFLDGPPALGSPDARILSDQADFVILVVGYGSGTADEIAKSAAMFEPSKFAGVVFNEAG
jgi:Mrp family chromosome partitioning ATPase